MARSLFGTAHTRSTCALTPRLVRDTAALAAALTHALPCALSPARNRPVRSRCYSIDLVVTGKYLPVLVLPSSKGGVIMSAVPAVGAAETEHPSLGAMVDANAG